MHNLEAHMLTMPDPTVSGILREIWVVGQLLQLALYSTLFLL